MRSLYQERKEIIKDILREHNGCLSTNKLNDIFREKMKSISGKKLSKTTVEGYLRRMAKEERIKRFHEGNKIMNILLETQQNREGKQMIGVPQNILQERNSISSAETTKPTETRQKEFTITVNKVKLANEHVKTEYDVIKLFGREIAIARLNTSQGS